MQRLYIERLFGSGADSGRGPVRRADLMLGTLIDLAIAYRENLGNRVAEAFMRETQVPSQLAQRVLDGSTRLRALAPPHRAICAPPGS